MRSGGLFTEVHVRVGKTETQAPGSRGVCSFAVIPAETLRMRGPRASGLSTTTMYVPTALSRTETPLYCTYTLLRPHPQRIPSIPFPAGFVNTSILSPSQGISNSGDWHGGAYICSEPLPALHCALATAAASRQRHRISRRRTSVSQPILQTQLGQSNAHYALSQYFPSLPPQSPFLSLPLWGLAKWRI